jgi:magnesium-transporting ATPase (P-type)
LLALVDRLGFEYSLMRNEYLIGKILYIHTFNSNRKYMATCVGYPNKRVYVKGASEIILDKCKYAFINNKSVPIKSLQSDLKAVISQMNTNSLRTLCIAYKEIESDEAEW